MHNPALEKILYFAELFEAPGGIQGILLVFGYFCIRVYPLNVTLTYKIICT